ncbi:MAG: hypothetical protein ACYC0N_00365 [Carboxydocellales bacterium]
MTAPSKGWKCQNCGHVSEGQTDNLEELGFQWLDQNTCKTSCQNCGSYTLNRATTYDDQGRPVAGYFLVVRTRNTIGKGG